MLVYNTTFQVDTDVESNFIIWIKEVYIHEVLKAGMLSSPRLCKILSHLDEGSSFSLQWEVENSTILHRWHMEHGAKLNDQIQQLFKDKVIGFPTLMELMEVAE